MSTNTKKPTHRAYVVTERGDDRKDSWTEIGAIFPNKDGGPGVLLIRPGFSVSGKIVIRPIDHEPEAAV